MADKEEKTPSRTKSKRGSEISKNRSRDRLSRVPSKESMGKIGHKGMSRVSSGQRIRSAYSRSQRSSHGGQSRVSSYDDKSRGSRKTQDLDEETDGAYIQKSKEIDLLKTIYGMADEMDVADFFKDNKENATNVFVENEVEKSVQSSAESGKPSRNCQKLLLALETKFLRDDWVKKFDSWHNMMDKSGSGVGGMILGDLIK